jgi:hypothetical protein
MTMSSGPPVNLIVSATETGSVTSKWKRLDPGQAQHGIVRITHRRGGQAGKARASGGSAPTSARPTGSGHR